MPFDLEPSNFIHMVCRIWLKDWSDRFLICAPWASWPWPKLRPFSYFEHYSTISKSISSYAVWPWAIKLHTRSLQDMIQRLVGQIFDMCPLGHVALAQTLAVFVLRAFFYNFKIYLLQGQEPSNFIHLIYRIWLKDWSDRFWYVTPGPHGHGPNLGRFCTSSIFVHFQILSLTPFYT